MLKEYSSDSLWNSGIKSTSAKSMTDINARKEQARKEREKKAAAQATAKQYKFSDQLKFNLKPRQNNDNESFLSKSVKHVLGDFHAFKSALRGNQEALFLGLDSSVPGTPEVKEFESDPLIIDNLLKPKNGIINHQQNQHLKKLIKNGVRSDFVQPKTKTDKTLTQKIIKHKPPKLKVPIACGGEHSPLGRLQEPKIEKILKEMTQCLPPLLSDIETPVKQAGFVFPKVAHPKTIESNNTLLKVKKEEEEEQVFNKSSEKHQSKDENSNKVGKVLASTEVPTTKTTSPSRKLSSSSSSSDGSSSGSSASSDSEDEEIAKTEKHLQQTTSIKDMNNMNLNSPLLAAELPQKIRKGSPLNNNYLLNKSNINDAKIVNNSLKETALQQPTIMQKIDKKTEASIDNDNLNFFGWENEKVISPLDNNLFSDLGFIGSGEENFVDDIFKSNVDVVEEKDKKDESFVSDTVFDNDYEQKSLPNPCLPRRGPSLYRKDSEQNDGRNKSSNKSNETKDKSKSKSTRIDASHPSVKVNSGSIGHSCLTKAQLKMPHRKKSLSESSTASVEDSPVRKTSGKIKAPKKGSDIVSKKDTFNKRKSKPTDYSCVENNAESKNKTDFDNICNNEKIKTYLKPIPTSPTNFSPNHQPETDKSTFNRDISKMAASSQQLLLDVNVSKENEIKGLRAPVLSNTTSLLNVGDVNFDEHELETTHFDGKLFETSTVTSIISPLMSPVSTSMHISNISLDDRGSETLSFNSNLTFNHSLKPHLSPIKDLLSPINDFVDSVTSNFEESVSMEIDNDDNDMHAPLVVEEKPSVDNDDNDMHASLVLEEKPSVELAQIDDNSLQILKKESLLSEVRPQATCLIDFARPLETLSMEVQKEHVTDDDHNQIELKPCFTQLISTVYDKKMSPGNCFDVIKTFDVKAEALSCSELRVKIPLKSIRLKDSTRLKYKNRTSHFKNSSETLTSPSNEDELVDVEGIESPLKRKRKLSIGLASHSTVPTTSADNSSDLFKSPNSFNLHTLVVRINLSKLKRVPHKATSADAQGLKLLLEKPSKIAKTESETSIKVEPITNTEDFLQSGNCTSKGVVKENTTKVPNLSMSSSKPTRNSTDTVLKKKKRGRPPKEKDGSKITEIKTEIPSPHVQKNVNSVLEKHANACNGEIIGEKDELKDKNVCLECGILRRDASQDAKKLAGYKKTYSTYFNEGRRAKHRADCLKNPVEKAHTYIDAAVSYLQYLIGLESCGKLSTKQGVTEYTQITSSCIDLVEYVITRFGRKTNSNISYDGRFLFLCLRLQSILYLKLFNIKKDSAMKYSKIISEYFKQYKPSADPSPYHKPVQKVGSTGTPSPSSPSPGPSPGGSVASIGSAGSSCSAGSNEKTANGVPSTFVSIPSDMHEKTFQYVQYTKYLVHSHRLWDEAELLTLHSQVFLSHLSRHAAVLTLHSSMLHLVDYVNAGLKFIKDSPLS